MKREIKFRSWIPSYTEMRYMPEPSFPYKDKISYNIARFFNTLDAEDCGHYIMQCTGLKDKSVKDIYEGDILENDNGVKYVVVWMEQLGGFYLQQPNTKRGKEIISCAASKVANEPMLLFKEAIVGNIYENPELLQAQKAQLSEPNAE
jgi:uncharacterized phage protein (TIGR01671 family)